MDTCFKQFSKHISFQCAFLYCKHKTKNKTQITQISYNEKNKPTALEELKVTGLDFVKIIENEEKIARNEKIIEDCQRYALKNWGLQSEKHILQNIKQLIEKYPAYARGLANIGILFFLLDANIFFVFCVVCDNLKTRQ